jgi:hypothetical protein
MTVDPKVERTEILLEQSNLLYNRLESNISSLKSRNSTFFTIMIAVTSIEITLAQIYFKFIWNTEYLWIYLLIIAVFLILIFSSGFFFYQVFKIKGYKEIKIFEEKRYKQLRTCNKLDLLQDFLYHIEEAFIFNRNIYRDDMKSFKRSFNLYITANVVLFISFILLFLTIPKTV